MGLITLHNETIYQIKVPLPFPLRWVNSYLIRGDNGYTLIDPGLHTAASEQCWGHVLQELAITYMDIEQIVLTHHHPDHYGLAGWLQDRSQAPVHISVVGYEQAQLLWGEGQPMTASLIELFRSCGLPAEMLAPMKGHMDEFVAMVAPQPEVSFISIGEGFRLGDDEYETIHTPGHAAGHVCFYRAGTKEMFCGDHVIPQISPNISYLPGGIDENPLGSFLQSLTEVSHYDVEWAYPGHREPFATFGPRAEELILHHEARLELMRQALIKQPQTAFHVCREAFGEKLTLHQLRFALSETLAHLLYLENQGLLQRSDQEGKAYFQSV
jgi:glyoxylase-like metal-dependent hydrolase (beta-lactamase superfamily II)